MVGSGVVAVDRCQAFELDAVAGLKLLSLVVAPSTPAPSAAMITDVTISDTLMFDTAGEYSNLLPAPVIPVSGSELAGSGLTGKPVRYSLVEPSDHDALSSALCG